MNALLIGALARARLAAKPVRKSAWSDDHRNPHTYAPHDAMTREGVRALATEGFLLQLSNWREEKTDAGLYLLADMGLWHGLSGTWWPMTPWREPLEGGADRGQAWHAAHVGIARIVDGEVVPQHTAAGRHPAPHRVGQLLLEGIVEQRAEHGEGQHGLLAGVRHRRRTGVAFDELHAAWQHGARGGGAFGQQLDAGQLRGCGAQAQQVQQVAAAAAAHFEQGAIGQAGPAMQAPKARHGVQALLLRLQGGCVGVQAVALRVGAAVAPRVACLHGAGLGRAHRVILAKRCAGVRLRSTSHRPCQVPQP